LAPTTEHLEAAAPPQQLTHPTRQFGAGSELVGETFGNSTERRVDGQAATPLEVRCIPAGASKPIGNLFQQDGLPTPRSPT
jgi:hypothetical protein